MQCINIVPTTLKTEPDPALLCVSGGDKAGPVRSSYCSNTKAAMH